MLRSMPPTIAGPERSDGRCHTNHGRCRRSMPEREGLPHRTRSRRTGPRPQYCRRDARRQRRNEPGPRAARPPARARPAPTFTRPAPGSTTAHTGAPIRRQSAPRCFPVEHRVPHGGTTLESRAPSSGGACVDHLPAPADVQCLAFAGTKTQGASAHGPGGGWLRPVAGRLPVTKVRRRCPALRTTDPCAIAPARRLRWSRSEPGT